MSETFHPLNLLVVGIQGGTSVGQSLAEAAVAGGHRVTFLESSEAFRTPRLVRMGFWHGLGRRPPRLGRFGKRVVEVARQTMPDVLLTTGASPVPAEALVSLGRLGIRRINISTDDPWNSASRADWFLRALPHYDTVFTPRRANEEELRQLRGPDVRYLPFGYDPALCFPGSLSNDERATLECDVLFVGGADSDRIPLIQTLVEAGLDVAVYGGYWNRARLPPGVHRGIADPELVRRATLAARVALILVRRANRDCHTMRSFEAGATGACLLAEDTADHRALYGADGAAFFRTTAEMVDQARALLRDPSRRSLLATRSLDRLRSGGNTYADRLSAILKAA